MARRQRPRGFRAPQRSPEELAKTLAELAAVTEEPRPEPRRPIPQADHSTRDVVWSLPDERLARQPGGRPRGESAAAETEAPGRPGRGPSTPGRPKPKRNVRRLYPPLLGILAIVIILALVVGGGKSSKKTPVSSVNNPRSAVPAPSATPTVASIPTVATTPAAKKQPVAPKGRTCRPLNVGGRALSVHILQGAVRCRRARAVLLAFETGKGKVQHSATGRYWLVKGWHCVQGGSCTRPGKSIKALGT